MLGQRGSYVAQPALSRALKALTPQLALGDPEDLPEQCALRGWAVAHSLLPMARDTFYEKLLAPWVDHLRIHGFWDIVVPAYKAGEKQRPSLEIHFSKTLLRPLGEKNMPSPHPPGYGALGEDLRWCFEEEELLKSSSYLSTKLRKNPAVYLPQDVLLGINLEVYRDFLLLVERAQDNPQGKEAAWLTLLLELTPGSEGFRPQKAQEKFNPRLWARSWFSAEAVVFTLWLKCASVEESTPWKVFSTTRVPCWAVSF
jgi:hypothetical protein